MVRWSVQSITREIGDLQPGIPLSATPNFQVSRSHLDCTAWDSCEHRIVNVQTVGTSTTALQHCLSMILMLTSAIDAKKELAWVVLTGIHVKRTSGEIPAEVSSNFCVPCIEFDF